MSKQSIINQIQITASRGDVEHLFHLYRLSLHTKDGKEIREAIEKVIDSAAVNSRLPSVSSFHELVDSYDRRTFRYMIEDEEQLDNLLLKIDSSKGMRMAILVGEAAFEAPVLAKKEFAAKILITLVKKMGLFPKLKSYLQKYPGTGLAVDFKVVKDIARQVVNEDNSKVANIFARVLNEIDKDLRLMFQYEIDRVKGVPYRERWM